MSEPTHLYRAYDAAGRLLYVGIAKNWPNRWTTHARTASFYGEVCRLEVETHPTREDALAAERVAIRAERPVHNVVHNRGETQPALTAKPTSRSSRRQDVPGSTLWHFASHMSGYEHHEHLWLSYEINLSACLTEAYPDEDPLEFFLDYLGRDRAKGRLAIYWSVKGPETREAAPFQSDDDDDPNFLHWFTWPVDEDGATLNWFSLPVECRFPALENALGWQPSPLQRYVDFGSLMRSLRGR